MSNGREDFTELQKVVIYSASGRCISGSCTQHEKCHDLISCIPSMRAWLNCTSTCFMHVACMHSTCMCCASTLAFDSMDICIRLV